MSLRSVRDIRKGSLIFSVDYAEMLTLDKLDEEELEMIKERTAILDYRIVGLTLYLLDTQSSRYKHSFNDEYLLSSSPSLIYQQELKKLYHQVSRYQLEAKRLYRDLQVQTYNITVSTWLQYLAIVTSRIHRIWHKDNKDNNWSLIHGLVPMAELLNTGKPEEVNVECTTNRETLNFECHSLKSIPSNSELLTRYGDGTITSIDLLYTYGLSFDMDCTSLRCHIEAVVKDYWNRILINACVSEFTNWGQYYKS